MILRPIPAAAVSYCWAIVFIATLIAAARADAQFVVGKLEPPYELWRINADGAGLARFAETPGYTCGSPDWSPDGKLIAYDTWRIGRSFNESKIAVIRPDGTKSKIIGNGGMPSWSPDGKQLTCHTYDNPQTIIVMNADGGGREVVINHWGSPRWWPNGNRIASLNTNGSISLFDIATGREQRILPAEYSPQIGFGISPDGRRLCFGDSQDHLYLATLDERTMQSKVRWLFKQGTARHCSWSPDGKRVVFGWKSNGQPLEQLFLIDVDSKVAKSLPGQDEKRNNSCPDWSPDGKTIIFVSQDPTAIPTKQNDR